MPKDARIHDASLVADLARPHAQTAHIGGKAHALAVASAAGLPVPRGFVVTTEAFRLVMAACPEAQAALADLSRAAADDRDALKRAALCVRTALRRVTPPEAVERAVIATWESLGREGAYAVRSSATTEDLPDAAFAGQHDTVLNVRGRDGVMEAVHACWASLFSDRAVLYRAARGVSHGSAAMAVIVQEMVDADIAGVMFTADPVTGAARIIIEGGYGLGESLVSGRTTPDRVVLSKPDGRILERTECDAAICTRTPQGARPLCLGDELVASLAGLGARCEKLFGRPQDVEWAAKDGRVYILQSRPITTLEAAPSFEDRQIWTNANVGEVLPNVATPLTWSVVEGFLHTLMGAFFGRLGISFSEHELARPIAGRAYFNASLFAAYMSAFPAPLRMDVREVFGGADVPDDVKRILSSREDMPHVRVSRIKLLARLPGFALWFATRTRSKAKRFLRELESHRTALAARDASTLPDEELISLVDGLHTMLLDNADGIAYTAAGMSCFGHLRRVCGKWLGDVNGRLANRLLTGVGGLDSAEAGLDMWLLAVFAAERPAVSAALLSTEGAPDRAAIAGVAGGEDFLARWDGFMERHGHHARAEVDIYTPRWSETPGYVADMLRGYLASMGKADPVAAHAQRRVEREELVAHCRRKLRNPLKRAAFGYLLRRAQEGIAFRENIKSESVRMVALVRRAALELGERLCRRGAIAERDDVFFLYAEEVAAVCRGAAVPDIATRKAEFAFNKALTPPPVVVGRFRPDDPGTESIPAGATVLHGLAVSAGVAIGKARVVLRSDDSERVLPGEILVAPFTDPGWTPYFLTAAGIVMDLGGMLSHGSIVAREYGIPAVANVGPATKLIRTGQMVRVDGNRGMVTLLGGDEAPAS